MKNTTQIEPSNPQRISATGPRLKDINDLKAPFVLPELTYPKDSLEPYMDAKTVEIHHDKHHKAYIEKLSGALEEDDFRKGQSISLLELLRSTQRTSSVGDAIHNNAGGHWNHSFFWTILSGNAANNMPSAIFAEEIKKKFGSMEEMKTKFLEVGMGRFGSGWVWLIRDNHNKLKIISTANQDNPLMDTAEVKGWPLLAADLWEHAYYLKFQNKRDKFIENFWSLVDWQTVEAYDSEWLRSQ